MPTIHRVPAGTLSASVRGPRLPAALDFNAVQAARIPQTSGCPGYSGTRRGSKIKSPGIYQAACANGFRYPNQFREPGPGKFWNAKNDRNTSR